MSTKSHNTPALTTSKRLSPPRILLHPANPQGSSPIYRIGAPADALRRTGFATTLVDFRRPGEETLKLLAPDVVCDQQPYADEHIASLGVYRKAGVYIVVDLDDCFWDMDEANPVKSQFPNDIKARMARCAVISDRVTVTTHILAERVRKDLSIPAGKITVLPNQLPQAFVTAARTAEKLPRQNKKPRIGWTGSLSHPGDLAILKEVVQRTAEQYQWVFMGSAPEGVEDLIEFHPAVTFSQFPTALGALDLDLGVIPLADTPFNACKSDLKVLEYGAAGYPVLASPSPALKERFADVDRPLAVTLDNDADSWIIAIADYLANAEARAHDAQRLHDWVKREGIIESFASLSAWSAAWTPARQVPFVPGDVEVACTDAIAFVGEPVGEPHFATIEDARKVMPGASVLYVRPGAVPGDEQISAMLARAIRSTDEETGVLSTFASVSALSNDGDYPAPSKFIHLDGAVAADMAAAALTLLDKADPIGIPYSSSPMVLLSATALRMVGIPDEKRYEGDTETALIEWCMRVNTLTDNAHIAAPNVFIPVLASAFRTAVQAKSRLSEIATWHPSFPQVQHNAASSDPFLGTRRALDLAYNFISYRAPQAKDYPQWLALHDTWTPATQAWADWEMEASWTEKPTVAIVMPVYNPEPDHFAAAVQSVIAQVYPHWHLYIVDDGSEGDSVATLAHEVVRQDPRISFTRRVTNGHICVASNDGLEAAYKSNAKWVLFLDHDDTLAPSALHMLVREVVLKPHLGMVYADSDLIAPDGTLHNPDFKPDFDYTLLLAQNYICHPCLYQLNKVRQIGGFKPGFEGSQDYDLSLRYIEAVGAGSVGHVPLVLYHWRQAATSVSSDIANKPYAIEAAAKAVLAHLTRKGVTAFAGPHPAIPSHHIVRYLPPDSAPRVCIIILTRTNRKQLEMCVGSILKNTLYSNYSVIIRQTGADAGVTETAARLVKAEPKRVRHVRGGADLPGTPFFNYALLNNAVAGSALAADAEVLVFLNDDTAILEGAWLSDMVGQALQPDTGAVGAKLIYPGGTVQHNGVGIDPYAPAGEVALHLYRGQPHSALGPAGRAAIAHECVAVTGACMAIRHSLFGEVGGFDAAKFPLDYNDTDLCLRLLCLGKRNVVLSHIVLQHNEGATKKARPELMSRSGMLASESALRDSEAFRAILGSDKLTFHANPNLMHEPSQAKLRNAPYRPWMSGAPLPATLLIGGDREDVQRVYVNGERPMSAVFDGPYLNMLEPPAPQVGLVDMRDKKTFEELLNGLGITHITLRRLGGGSSEALGMLTAMANDGMPVDYQPASFESVCPRLTCTNSLGPCNHEWKQGANGCQVCVDRDGSEHGYVAVASYRNDWNRFAAALTAASETVVQTDEAAK